MLGQTLSIPVALVSNVYFPSQKLRFKVNDPSRHIFSIRDGAYGIVSKKLEDTGPYELSQFKDHYEVGVLVRITDQQTIMSNLVQNYAEFGVEAIQRFRIKKVLMT